MGGCLNKQHDIADSDNYITVLRTMLHERGTEATTAKGLYLHYHHAVSKVAETIAVKKPDILCFFLRPFPLIPLFKLSIKYPTIEGGVKSMLHPALLNRNAAWNVVLSDHQTFGAFTYVKRRRVAFRDLNIALGLACGLAPWALRYMTSVVNALNRTCKEAGVKLIIMTPPKSPGSLMGDRVCRKTAKVIDSFCRENEISCIDIHALPYDRFSDGVHLKKEGHLEIAEMIHKNLLAIQQNIE